MECRDPAPPGCGVGMTAVLLVRERGIASSGTVILPEKPAEPLALPYKYAPLPVPPLTSLSVAASPFPYTTRLNSPKVAYQAKH
jgi:hypothetical protein